MTRRNHRRAYAGAAGVLAGALALSACSGGTSPEGTTVEEGEPYTLTVWTNYTTGPGQNWFEEVAAQFEAEHENITVEAQHVQNEELDGKLQTALNSGDAPDVFLQRGGGKMKDMAAAGQLLDLTDTAVATPEMREKLGEASYEALSIDGQLLAAPQLIQPGGIWYSKDLFAEAGITELPETVEDLEDAIAKLQGAGITPIALGGKDAWPAAHWYYFFALRECSAETLEATNESLDFSDECYERAAQDVTDLAALEPFNEGFLTTSAQQGASSSAGLLANHKAAMELMGAWQPGVVMNLTPDQEPLDDLGWFPFPQVSSGEGDAAAIMGGQGGFSCSAAAPKELCGEFLALMNSEEHQEGFYEAFGTIPLHDDAKDVVTNEYDEQMLDALAEASYVSDFLDTNYGQQVGTALNQAVVELLTGGTDPAGFVSAVSDAAARS
ncbi:ABC transporter substrate-binding protein [Myceligenerans xiligouense]|uniref:Carbohydrate ABC transporter substrate-binding protein (CUT1 family) n=1 Tax=Myceligenerans xiligouense TaxID=253184 RepID=A0A3N4Z5E7_9MICO|nr:extracellular solute-binding protein [Myceligenerans xiligouense]RPF20442.1 carbohydrate ABC transporter substrate-binding protein (CUT1 family) [Myceligenerans xiligouense]